MERSGGTWKLEVFCSHKLKNTADPLASFPCDELEAEDKSRQSDLEVFPVLFRWLHLF